MATTTKLAKPLVLSDGEARALARDGRVELRRAIRLPADDLTDSVRVFDPDAGRPFWRFSLSFNGACQCYDVDCPYAPGARFWGKEGFRAIDDPGAEKGEVRRRHRDEDGETHYIVVDYRAEPTTRIMDMIGRPEWKPALIMPRWASRFGHLVVAPGTRAEQGERGWEWVFTVEREEG